MKIVMTVIFNSALKIGGAKVPHRTAEASLRFLQD